MAWFAAASAAAQDAESKRVAPYAATPQDVVDAMTDHEPEGMVGGVCCHPDKTTDPVLWHRTLATVAIDVESATLDVRADGPCGRREHPDAATVA